MKGKGGGKKPAQHFLPRLLMRGFGVRRNKNQYYVYEFRNNGVVRNGEVGTVGHQRWFYGNSDDFDKRETKYAKLLQTMRTESIDDAMKPQIDELVSHLLLRTNNFRTGMVQMGTEMGNGVLELFERAQPGSQFYDLIQQGASSAETQETIDREMAKLPEAVRPLYRGILHEWFNSPLMLDTLRNIVRQAMPRVDIPGLVRNAQVQVLQDEDRVLERAKSLQPFIWKLIEYEPNALVLGDHGPLGQESGQTFMRNLMLMDGITEIFLPVSHQRLLVGSLDGRMIRREPEFVNRNSAELSYEFFVARTDSPRERSYVQLIGARARLYDPAELRRLIDEQL